jgi:uncharacterized protein
MSILLKFSDFMHIFKKDDAIAYYNSLRLRPLYVTQPVYKILEELKTDVSAFTQSTLMNSISNVLSIEEQENLINGLLKYKIIVPADDYDEKIISTLRQQISPPYPQIAYFILTENCNFSCSYCFVKAGDKRKLLNMKESTALDALDFFCRLIQKDHVRFEEEKTIIFYGGEPLLNLHTLEFLLSKIHSYKESGKLPKKTSLSIITNGSLLTHNVVDLLSRNQVSIGISVDGNADSTDSCRVSNTGKKVFSEIENGINICKELGVSFSLSVTLSEKAISSGDNTIVEILRFSPNSLGFNILMSEATQNVSPSYNKDAAEFLIKAFRKFRGVGLYEDRMMRKAKAFSESQFYYSDCGAVGGNQVVFAPDGAVGICHGYLPTRKFFVTDISDTYFMPEENDVYKEWARRSPINMKECLSCSALGICGGGCPCNAEKMNGSIWALDSRFCTHAKMTLEWLIWDVFESIQPGRIR